MPQLTPFRLPLALILALIVVWCGCKSQGTPTATKQRPEGVPVTVAAVKRRDVPVEIQVIGNVEAHTTITVRAQVGGELMNVHFTEGDYVKKGDLLFTIDRRPLEAQLNQAEANLARDRALLNQAQATLAKDIAQEQYAQAQAGRYARLFQEGVISKEQTEQVRTNADASAQSVTADKAAIESARAAVVAGGATVQNARVQLGYTVIRSPIDGRTGNVMAKQGNIVAANSFDLVTINQVQPIYVTFSVPEAQLPAIKRYMALGKLPVNAVSQDGESLRESGVLTFVDNTVDPTTGTIKLKGTFTNADRKLWPGEFVRVVLRLTTDKNALVVPNQAVQSGQEGQFVYVVKPDRVVESRPVEVGSRVDQDTVIEKGLQDGEVVVTDGQLRLAPGSRVQFRDNRVTPGRKKSPNKDTNKESTK